MYGWKAMLCCLASTYHAIIAVASQTKHFEMENWRLTRAASIKPAFPFLSVNTVIAHCILQISTTTALLSHQRTHSPTEKEKKNFESSPLYRATRHQHQHQQAPKTLILPQACRLSISPTSTHRATCTQPPTRTLIPNPPRLPAD